jgi:membrane-bound ClpP family serine protease
MEELLLDALIVACVLLIAVGAGLIFMPAGLITGGALGLVVVLNMLKGVARDRSTNSPGA